MYAHEMLWRVEHGLCSDSNHNDYLSADGMLSYPKQSLWAWDSQQLQGGISLNSFSLAG